MVDPRQPALVVVGYASRDLVDDDARGWRLGGAVAYVALAAARLGVTTAAVLATDAVGAMAQELDLLRAAGVQLHAIVAPEAPVFRNVETPAGRRQECLAAGPPLEPDDVPAAWRRADAWALVPVLGELSGSAWAAVPPRSAFVAFGWQGLLREARAGGPTRPRPPGPDPLLERADLTVGSRDDLGGLAMTDLAAAARLLPLFPRPGQEVVITAATEGGWLMVRSERGWDIVPYEALEALMEVDLTGAGDVFLAAYLATAVEPDLVPPGRAAQGVPDRLRFAAAAAALSVGGPGISAIPTRSEVQARLERPAGSADREGGAGAS